MKRWMMILTFAGLLLALGASAALAQSGYDISWWTADGGGGSLSNGGYTLSATIGQPDAGTLSSGGYTLNGGFWHAGSTGWQLMLPVVAK